MSPSAARVTFWSSVIPSGFFWLAAESGLRAGELIALRASDVDVEKLSVEVTKAIWNGSEDSPKTEAAFRSVCISSRLGSQVKEYLAGRTDGYLFQTSSGNPWGASNVLERKLNTVLDRLDYGLRELCLYLLYCRYCCFVHMLQFFSYRSL